MQPALLPGHRLQHRPRSWPSKMDESYEVARDVRHARLPVPPHLVSRQLEPPEPHDQFLEGGQVL